MTCEDERRKCGAPAPKARRSPWLVIPAGEYRQGWVLSDATFGFWLHWCDADPQLRRRSYLHRGVGMRCDFCDRRNVARWSGALSFLPDGYRAPVLLGVTLTMLETCPELDPASGVPLRGAYLRIERPGSMPYGALRAYHKADKDSVDRLPNAFNVPDQLALRYEVPLQAVYDAMVYENDPSVIPFPPAG